MKDSFGIWLYRIQKIIEVLRPKFYNKLTWLIVISGLSIMSKPLWLTLINIAFEKMIEFSITENSDTAWGFALVVTGLLYHLINTGLYEFVIARKGDALNQKKEVHDTQVFKSLDEMIDEPYIENVFAHMHTSDAIFLDDFTKLRDFVVYASESRNQFLTQELKLKTQSFLTSLEGLLCFINKEFDEYPYGQDKLNFRMCLAPQLNCDRGGSWEDGPKYDVLVRQMMDLSASLNDSYKNWRLSVKENLAI
ncbi:MULTISPECIES: hypothetical protein [unclassified Pseudoalteromonas]|uniref:hypothetical protein n=1 Tax=Pseudoalteromonas TaxID=53246 RepID=UPI00331FA93E